MGRGSVWPRRGEWELVGEVREVGRKQVMPGHGSHGRSLRFSKVLVFFLSHGLQRSDCIF